MINLLIPKQARVSDTDQKRYLRTDLKMRDPVKLLGFIFWLFFFNSGQCQECRRENINYENTEPVAKASYSDGETVRLKCMTGFTGMYRLQCAKGEWTKTAERPCAKKKCSHPGDTANGDFKLMGGSDFVFGVTALYTCKKGFYMSSRINQRTCRAQGWDNAVPVCEIMKCPAIRTDGDVTASGNTEEGSYGDVVQFECVSSNKKIHGSSEIYCTERGEWSDSVPTCKAITCTPPDILHGRVLDRVQEYPKDAILKYSCSEGFKPREGIPKCAKFGWTLNPECDDLTCQINSRIFGANKINPEGKTLFRVGESVEITCAESHWIYGTKETIRSFTCQKSGNWDHQPICVEITCEVPRNQHVNYPDYYFSGYMKLGAEKTYYCMSGYEQKAAVAKCTQEGWTPKPLCAERMCAAPNIPNANIEGERRQTYRISSKIQYKCHRGFEPEQPVEITCTYYGWTRIQHCTEKKNFCLDPPVENGFIYRSSSNEEEIFYTCNTGYTTFSWYWWDSVTCSEGSWSKETRCIREEECGAFPTVDHGKIKPTKQTKHIFRHGDRTAFECDQGFKPTPSFIKCVRGKWETPVCEDVRCGIPPKVENAFITSKPKDLYLDGSSVTYECRKSFLMNGENTVFCHSGSWEKAPTCTEVKCVAKLTERMRSDADKNERNGTEISVRPGRTINLTCDGDGVKLQGPNKITCQSNGEWNVPFPECVRDSMERSPDFEGPFKPGQNLTFSWNKQGQREITCQSNGNWSSPFPKCEAKTTDEVNCTANLTEKMRSDATKDKRNTPKISVKPGSTITLSCLGRKMKLQGPNKITCQSNGEWNVPFPKCKMEDSMEQSPDFEGPFKPGQKLTFSWNIQGPSEITCQSNGEWSSPFPKCEAETTGEVKCVAKLTERMRSDATEDELTGTEISVRPGRTITLSCLGRKMKLQGPSEITCQSNGEWNVPFPKCRGGKCGPPPNVEFADTTEMPKKEYDSGETVEYVCFNKYTLAESRPYSKHLTCDNGEWTGNIRCLKPCSVTVEEMDKRGIELRWGRRQKIFLPHEDRITFRCQWGKSSTGIDLVQTCNDGVMNLPQCV